LRNRVTDSQTDKWRWKQYFGNIGGHTLHRH